MTTKASKKTISISATVFRIGIAVTARRPAGQAPHK
jgi:hypothetical protein